MLRYFFSFGLLLSFFLVKAQDVSKDSLKSIKPNGAVIKTPTGKGVIDEKKGSTTKTDRYGMRVGIDLFRFTRGFYEKNYKGIEFTGDYRLTKKYFLAAEIGNENKTTNDDRMSFTTKGSYIKAGFDYNAYENWLDMENMITIGLRYGVSTFSQQLNNYTIYNSSSYFGATPTIPSGEKYDGLTASWVEVVAGIKAKVFNNIFVGFSLRLNTLISNKKPHNFDNFYIPGFNRTYDGDFGVGFNYSISYFIPIYKKRTAILKKEVPKKEVKK